jgi:hypothetical protein
VTDAGSAWRVAAHGAVLAHFVDPYLQLEEKTTELNRIVEQAASDSKLIDATPDHRVVYMAGRCDLLLELTLPDFRFVSDLQKHLLSFPALSSTWVFTVPLQREARGRPRRPVPCAERSAIHFVLYLRLQRSLFRFPGIERAVVERLHALIEGSEGIEADIHLGLGWADLLLRGRFDCDIERFLSFVIAVQSIHVGSGERRRPVFQRTLTLLGFDEENGVKPHAPLRPMVFGQIVPGEYARARRELRRRLEADAVGSRIRQHWTLDGHHDIVLALAPEEPGTGFDRYWEQLRALADGGAALRDAGLHRLETHLMVVDSEILLDAVAEEELRLPGFEAPERPCCDCASLRFEDVLRELAGLPEAFLPPELRTTVFNVLTLFGYALRDETNCCDAVIALRACSLGLRRLLGMIRQLAELVESGQNAAFWYDAMEGMRGQLDSWCVHAEKVLGERVAGSFLQFFDQSGHVSAYRGGVQKLLHITDHLADELYTVATRPQRTGERPWPLFATTYEPIDSIRSEPVLGVIMIPLRYRFTIPLVLPQIWQEVGQFLFQHRNPSPLCPTMNKRLLRLDRVLMPEEGFAALRGLDEREREELLALRGEYAGRSIFELSSARIVQDLGDMYADLFVFSYAFRLDWSGFLHYLTTLFFETKAKKRMPREVWDRHAMALATRLFFVTSFYDRWVARQEGEEPMIDEPAGRKLWARVIADRLLEIARKSGSGERAAFPDDLARKLYDNIAGSAVYNVFFQPYLLDFLEREELPAPDESWKRVIEVAPRLAGGELVDFADDERINDHYYYLYGQQVREILGRGGATTFRHAATLRKSASSAFFRRQAG